MSIPTPRTDAARGFHDMDTAVSAEDMAQLETEFEAMTARAEKAEAELKEMQSSALTWARFSGEKASCADLAEQRLEKAEAELVRLRADLERFTGHGLLDCHAICDQRDAAVAERDQLRADRTYNHECINRLASATGTLGEKSGTVVDVALSTIAQLREELAVANNWAEHHAARGNDLIAENINHAEAAIRSERLWKEFITLMDITEESDSGNAFNPNKISSCRAMDGKRLNEILNEARQIVFKQ